MHVDRGMCIISLLFRLQSLLQDTRQPLARSWGRCLDAWELIRHHRRQLRLDSSIRQRIFNKTNNSISRSHKQHTDNNLLVSWILMVLDSHCDGWRGCWFSMVDALGKFVGSWLAGRCALRRIRWWCLEEGGKFLLGWCLVPLDVGSLRAVITVLYQAKGIAKVNGDRCDISSNKEIIIVI